MSASSASLWTQGRIGQVAIDPILPVKAFMDIGGAGHSSDAMAIWICQFVSREIRLLDYIEGVGQSLACYAGELRRRGWKEAVISLPHDGVAHNNITGKSRAQSRRLWRHRSCRRSSCSMPWCRRPRLGNLDLSVRRREIRLLDYIEASASRSPTMLVSYDAVAGRTPLSACRMTAWPLTTSPANATSTTGEKPK